MKSLKHVRCNPTLLRAGIAERLRIFEMPSLWLSVCRCICDPWSSSPSSSSPSSPSSSSSSSPSSSSSSSSSPSSSLSSWDHDHDDDDDDDDDDDCKCGATSGLDRTCLKGPKMWNDKTAQGSEVNFAHMGQGEPYQHIHGSNICYQFICKLMEFKQNQ